MYYMNRFAKWLEETHGISWEYFDNNYGGKQADELFEEFDEYESKMGEEKLMWFRTEDGFYVSEEELLNRASKAGFTGIDAYRYMLRLNLRALETVKMDFYGGTGRYYENKPVNYMIGHMEDGCEIYAECLIPDDEEIDEDYGYMRMIKMLMIYCNDELGMDVYLEGCEPYDPESPEACIGDRITICIDDGWDELRKEV